MKPKDEAELQFERDLARAMRESRIELGLEADPFAIDAAPVQR